MMATGSSAVRRAGLGSVILAVGVLVVAGCSSSSKSVSAGASPTVTTAATTGTTAGATASATVLLGTKDPSVLVDAKGMTLYTFDQDTTGASASACTGACASAWPPLTASGTPTAGPGVTGTLATISGGQVTWDGHPLYHWMGDKAPGDATGDGINGFHTAKVGAGGGTTASTAPPTTAKSGSGY